MPENLKNKLIAVKNHINLHRGKYSALATLAVVTPLYLTHVKDVNEFLDSKGLLNEFYHLQDLPVITE